MEYKPELARLSGYLQNSMWTSKERIIIEQIKELFMGYTQDAQHHLIHRLLKFPRRWRYAFLARGFSACLLVTMHTTLPYK